MSIEQQKEKLKQLIGKLVSHGEDPDELWFWQEIFDAMEEDHRQELLDNLEKELSDIEQVKSA